MRINHGGGDIFVPKQFLDGTNICAALDQMGGKAVPEGVATGSLINTSRANGMFDCVLQVFFRDMMAASLAIAPVDRKFGGRKDVLPTPVARGVWIFAGESEREI